MSLQVLVLAGTGTGPHGQGAGAVAMCAGSPLQGAEDQEGCSLQVEQRVQLSSQSPPPLLSCLLPGGYFC